MQNQRIYEMTIQTVLRTTRNKHRVRHWVTNKQAMEDTDKKRKKKIPDKSQVRYTSENKFKKHWHKQQWINYKIKGIRDVKWNDIKYGYII